MGQKQIFWSGLTEVVTQNTSLPNNGAKEQLGTTREENQNSYKYVQFSGTTAASAGDFVCYVAKGSDGNAFIVDKANTNLGAGVAMGAIASGSVQYGWIQIKGMATLNTAFTTGADNNTMTSVGATAGTIAVAAAVTNAMVGVAYDVAGKKVLLDCPY